MSFAHVVLVGSGVGHLDQAYTYRIPDGVSLHIGSLLRVPVRGRSREGVVVRLIDEADVPHIQPIRAVLGPGLPPDVVTLCREVADHYLSSLGEALSAALPPRIADEEETLPSWPAIEARAEDLSWLGDYKNAPAMLEAIRDPGFRAFGWRPLAQLARGGAIASLAAESLRRGRGVLVLLPEVRAASSVARALAHVFGDAVAWLGSDRSVRERYRAWLALQRGDARIAVGGRGAVFAPVPDLGLIIVDDEGHVSYKERRTPRFHARPVAFGRARAGGATLVAVGVPPSIEVTHSIDRNAMTAVSPTRATETRSRPAVVVVDRSKIDERHTPSARTLTVLKTTLGQGRRAVVLVHRAGDEVRAIATRIVRAISPKNPARLDSRTLAKDAKAFGRAIEESDLIVSTPVIAKDIELIGIGCIAVLEADAALATPEFRAAEEAFATWWRSARWLDRDGTIVIETSAPRAPAIAALVRWDSEALARAEHARRSELSYPPFGSLIRVECPPDIAASINEQIAEAAPGAEVLGPVTRRRDVAFVLRSRDRRSLVSALKPLAERWRREGTAVRIDVDPRDVLR